MKKLPLTHALAWIIASTFLVTGTAYPLFKHFLRSKYLEARDSRFAIRSLIQTGPQKEALKTEYLAQLLGLSSDRPPHAKSFDLKRAEERLRRSPLISSASVKLIPPGTLYVDYTVRRPIAWLEDYKNIAVDKEGVPFPFTPFFSPKHLPALYLGLGPFAAPSSDPERPNAQWHTPMHGKYLEIALEILQIVSDPKASELFSAKRIDVSKAFAPSLGRREIVVLTEDVLIKKIEGQEVRFYLPRLLRLSTKNYTQELSNYLKLREQLLAEEEKNLPIPTGLIYRCKEKVIDFRLDKLAFIEGK